MGRETGVKQTGSKALSCYEFTVTNTTGRVVSDVHIPIGTDNKTDIPPHGPRGWQGRHDKDGITFETPVDIPPRRPGETRPRPLSPRHIPPNKSLRGFTFYLAGKETTEGMFFTFPESEETQEGSVEQGGRIIQPSETGTVKPSKLIYCFEITIYAPKDKPVHIVDIRTDKPLIHGVTDPDEGWIVNTHNEKNGSKETGSLSGFSIGDKAPIPAGGKRKFRLYSRSKKLKIDWTLMGSARELLHEGDDTLKFS